MSTLPVGQGAGAQVGLSKAITPIPGVTPLPIPIGFVRDCAAFQWVAMVKLPSASVPW